MQTPLLGRHRQYCMRWWISNFLKMNCFLAAVALQHVVSCCECVCPSVCFIDILFPKRWWLKTAAFSIRGNFNRPLEFPETHLEWSLWHTPRFHNFVPQRPVSSVQTRVRRVEMQAAWVLFACSMWLTLLACEYHRYRCSLGGSFVLVILHIRRVRRTESWNNQHAGHNSHIWFEIESDVATICLISNCGLSCLCLFDVWKRLCACLSYVTCDLRYSGTSLGL